MSLPYDKSGSVKLELNPNTQISSASVKTDMVNFLKSQNFNDIKVTDEINFTTTNSLFKIPYQITFCSEVKDGLIIKYKIKLLSLLKLTIIVAIVGAFFARLSIEKFLIFELLLVSIFYLLNMALIEFSIKKMITDFASKAQYLITDPTEEELQIRMSDSSICPSCGGPLSDTDLQCPSCKLHIPLKRGFKQYNPNAIPPKPKPEQKITYTYINKKK